MKKARFFIFIAAVISALLIAPVAMASTATEAQNLADVLASNPASGYTVPYGSGNFPTENINPVDGGLTLSATDLYLPGKNGLDVELKRIFDSVGVTVGKVANGTRETWSVSAFKYYYTTSSGSKKTINVMFASAAHMLGTAPNGFYSSYEQLNKTPSKDDNSISYYIYDSLLNDDGEVWLTRDVSAKPVILEFYSIGYFNMYQDFFKIEIFNDMWSYSLPHLYEITSIDGDNSYEGYGMFVDYDGEAHTIDFYYTGKKTSGGYIYNGSIDVKDDNRMKGYVETSVYEKDPSIQYMYRIVDNKGRTLYFSRAGKLVVAEDRFGNYIRYYYDGYMLSKIIDTLGRTILFTKAGTEENQTYTVTVDSENDGVIDKKIVYTMTRNNNDELDPNNYLTDDDYGIFKVSVYEADGSHTDTVYDYNYSESAYHRLGKNYSTCVRMPSFNITAIYHPNGLTTKYALSPLTRNQGGFQTKNVVTRRADNFSGKEYNAISYDNATATDSTVVETNESKNLTTKYKLSSQLVSTKTVEYDNYKYYEEYAYGYKKRLTSTKRHTGNGVDVQTVTYRALDGAITNTSRNTVETTKLSYYTGTSFVKEKIYSIGTNRYIKEEYILNDEQNGDKFKNRNVIRINVYESTDNKKTYVLKETTDFTYDEYGNVSSQTLDPDGRAITSSLVYTYENGNIITQNISPSLTNADGGAIADVTTTSVIDSFGREISFTDGNGNTTLSAYDAHNRIVSSTDPLGSSDEYDYDIPSRTLVHTAKNGQKTKVIYDGFGNVLELYKMYNGRYTLANSYTYDAACRPVTATEYISYSGTTCTQKLVTTYTWGQDDKLVSQVTKDISGNVVDEKNYSYSYGVTIAANNRTAHDNTNRNYAIYFNTVTLTRPTKDGITPPSVKEYYDVKGRLIKRVTTDGNNSYVYTCIYDHLDNVLEEKDEYSYLYKNPLDYSTKTEYDYKGRPVKVYNAEGNATTYKYDSVGNLVSVTDPLGGFTEYTYDGLGRALTKSVYSIPTKAAVTKYSYDGNGNLLSSKIPTASRTESYTYDALNRPVTAYDGRYYTKYQYDVMGNVTKSVSGLSSSGTSITSLTPTNTSYTVVTYAYDSLGNLTSKTDAIGTTAYTYDFAGRQLTVKDGNGITTNNTYSPTGLVKTSNAGGDLITNTYDFWGNLKTSKRGSDTTTYYTYDNMFNMVKETQGTVTKAYSYDGLGMLLNFNLKYGSTVLQNADYTYDIMGRMATVSDGVDNVSYTYNAVGALSEQINGNIDTYYSYDYAGHLLKMYNTRITKKGDVDLSVFTYTYRDDGNISAMTDTREGETTQKNSYSYLADGSLSYAYLGSDTYYYSTNNRGNRTSSYVKGSDGIYHRTTNTYTTGNRISSSYGYDGSSSTNKYDVTSYTYDGNGNTLTTTVDTVTATKAYSNRNETKTYSKGGTSASYTYGADGLRTSKTVNGTKTTYIWSGGNIVAEITGDKYVVYLYGLNRISRKIMGPQYRRTEYEYDDDGEISSATDIEFYHEIYLYDGHGNVVQLVNERIIKDVSLHWFETSNFPPELDVNGDGFIDIHDLNGFSNTSWPVTNSYHYDAFGNQLDENKPHNTNPFRYCGEYWDSETGEIYLRARYYNPGTGRFTTVDPAMDGVNWYVYCKGNPIGFVDPWGMDSYVLYDPNIFGVDTGESYVKKDRTDLKSLYGTDCHLVPVTSKQEFIDAWNDMDDENIDAVVLFFHANDKLFQINGNAVKGDNGKKEIDSSQYEYIRLSDITSLEEKNISVVVSLGCNAGRTDVDYNLATALLNKTGVNSVIASDGNVSHSKTLFNHKISSVKNENYHKDRDNDGFKYYRNVDGKIVITEVGKSFSNVAKLIKEAERDA